MTTVAGVPRDAPSADACIRYLTARVRTDRLPRRHPGGRAEPTVRSRCHPDVVGPDRDPEQPDVVVFGGARADGRLGRPRLRKLGLPAVLAAVVLAAVVARVAGSSGTAAAPSPSPSPVAPSPSPLPRLTSDAPEVTRLGHPLLGVTARWDLFGLGADGVVRIELSRGRITRTAVPPVDSSGPISFLAGPGTAIVRPLDAVAGYSVPDGRPALTLAGPLGGSGPALPGPDPAHLWVVVPSEGQMQAMRLIGFDGRPTASSIALPPISGGNAAPDGAGYLMVYAAGGTYDLRPGSVRRITTGQLLAIGPTGWLALECDDQLHCFTVAIDRSTWARRVLGPVISTVGPPGLISPDGRAAAIVALDSTGAASVHVIDMSNGKDRGLAVWVRGNGDGMVWSPDGRWLFVAGTDARVHAIDHTGRDHDLGVRPLVLDELTIRAAP
jgi:hypothetical protein